MMISLGALGGGKAPIDYIREIMFSEQQPEHIFVFTGDDRTNDETIKPLAGGLSPTCHLHIIPKQTEEIVAKFMRRADLLVIKPGGITTMNVMSMLSVENRKKRNIIIHKPENKSSWIERKLDEVWYWLFSTPDAFKEGVSWENYNAIGLKNFCDKNYSEVVFFNTIKEYMSGQTQDTYTRVGQTQDTYTRVGQELQPGGYQSKDDGCPFKDDDSEPKFLPPVQYSSQVNIPIIMCEPPFYVC